jgi:hypothetical protein
VPKTQSKPVNVPLRSSALLRSYKRAVLWRKMMLVAFSIIFLAIMFWAIPWLPYGLSVEDYSDRITLLIMLVLMASITAFGSVYHRDMGRHIEQTLLTWTSVHEGLGDLRSREYFYDRIVIECERAKQSRSQFTVVALRMDDNDPEDGKEVQNSEQALSVLAPTTRESDFLAILGPRELGILVPGVGAVQAPAFAMRSRSLIEMAGPDGATGVRVGWAVYPIDAEEAGSLVGLARERLLGKKGSDNAVPPEYESSNSSAA